MNISLVSGMAAVEAAPNESIKEFPEELLVKIFYYIPLRQLDKNISEVCKKWARVTKDRNARATLEVSINSDSADSYQDSIKYLVESVKENGSIQCIRVIVPVEIYKSKDNLFNWSSAREAEKQFCLTLVREIVPSANNLRTLYLETKFFTSLICISMNELWEHPFLDTVKFVNREFLFSNARSNLHMKLVNFQKALNIYVKTMSDSVWGEFKIRFLYPEPIDSFIPDFCTAFEVSEICLPKSSESSKEQKRFSMDSNHFDHMCQNNRALEKLKISINSSVSLPVFMSVTLLTKLKELEVKMKYPFSRSQLAKIFEDSSFPNMIVKIIELESQGDPEVMYLREGRISISFMKDAS